MTNRDKKDSIRGRMAETGEPFNVARRKVEAAAAGYVPEDLYQVPEDVYQLIEVDVGTDHERRDLPSNPRHFESFRGRWIVEPDPEKPCLDQPPSNRSVYYGVAQTRRGRIAVYQVKAYPPVAGASDDDRCWEGELNDYDTLADAGLPPDIKRQVAAALDIREVIHRDI